MMLRSVLTGTIGQNPREEEERAPKLGERVFFVSEGF